MIVSNQKGKESHPVMRAIGRILRWLFFSVIMAMIPFIICEMRQWYIGYSFNLFRKEYLQDFVLITFAVASCTCENATDKERAFWTGIKGFFGGFSVATLFFCALFYSWILWEKPQEDRNSMIFISTSVLLAINAIIGGVFQIYPQNQNRNRGIRS